MGEAFNLYTRFGEVPHGKAMVWDHFMTSREAVEKLWPGGPGQVRNRAVRAPAAWAAILTPCIFAIF